MAPSIVTTALLCVATLSLTTHGVPVSASPSPPARDINDPCMLAGITTRSSPTYLHPVPTKGQASIFAICEGASVRCFVHNNAFFPFLPVDCPASAVESRRLDLKSKSSVHDNTVVSKVKPVTTTGMSTPKTKISRKAAKPNGNNTILKTKTTASKLIPHQQEIKSGAIPSSIKGAVPSKTTSRTNNDGETVKATAAMVPAKPKKDTSKADASNNKKKTGTLPSPKTRSSNSTIATEAGSSADMICNHKGTRIRGYQALGDRSSFYAVCETSVHPPTLTCYQDLLIADSPVPNPEVPCKIAPPVLSKKTPTSTKRDSRHLLVHDPTGKLWPKGVVCYEFENLEEPTLKDFEDSGISPEGQKIALEGIMKTYKNLDRLTLAGVSNKVRRAMDFYERSANIQFIPIDECSGRSDSKHICGNCKFRVQIRYEFSPLGRFGGWSIIGFNYMNPRYIEVYTDISFQHLTLSPGYWKFSNLLHELGHTLGMQHDHQHPDRTVIIDPVVAKARGIPTDQFKIRKSLVGEYDPKSIMHYGSYVGLCVRKPQFAKTNFCDLDEDPDSSGCVTPVTDKHCDISQSKALGGTTLSAGDIRKLRELYGDPKEHVPDFEEEEDDETYTGASLVAFTSYDLQMIKEYYKAENGKSSGRRDEVEGHVGSNDHDEQQGETGQ